MIKKLYDATVIEEPSDVGLKQEKDIYVTVAVGAGSGALLLVAAGCIVVVVVVLVGRRQSSNFAELPSNLYDDIVVQHEDDNTQKVLHIISHL